MVDAKAFQPPDYGRLLEWLSPDRSEAEKKFQRIRRDLIRIVASRGCPVPEDLADEAIARVAQKVSTIVDRWVGDPGLYFNAVVRNVHREDVRRRRPSSLDHEPPAPGIVDETAEKNSRCLDQCLKTISETDQALILDYYSQDRSDKIAKRKAMATQIGTGLNGLRIRAYRIRQRLFQCVIGCLEAATV
jgi:DNA-directed RNA polymerase specialized sigma24 family protein